MKVVIVGTPETYVEDRMKARSTAGHIKEIRRVRTVRLAPELIRREFILGPARSSDE